jgi:hypothetical protein
MWWWFRFVLSWPGCPSASTAAAGKPTTRRVARARASRTAASGDLRTRPPPGEPDSQRVVSRRGGGEPPAMPLRHAPVAVGDVGITGANLSQELGLTLGERPNPPRHRPLQLLRRRLRGCRLVLGRQF